MFFRWGQSDAVQFLTTNEAELEATNGGGVTALRMACRFDNVDTVKVLLKAGANPNCTDPNGDKCIHIAARQGSHKVSHMLRHLYCRPFQVERPLRCPTTANTMCILMNFFVT